MDTDALLSHARARFDHEAARRVMREKYEAKMIFAHAGGMWRAGPELLVLLNSIPVEDSVVIQDLYNNPVRVMPQELFDLAMSRWQEQMNAWLVEFDQNSTRR